MNKTKRIIAMVLSVLMVFSALPISALAYTTDSTADDTAAPTYTVNSTNGVITVVQANGTPIVIDVDPANLLDDDPDNDDKIYVWDEAGNKLNDYPISDAASVYATSLSGSNVYQNTKVTIKAGTIKNLYACGTKATVTNAELVIDGGNVLGGIIYGAMAKTATVENYTLTIKSGSVNKVAGAGLAAIGVKNTVINVNGGEVKEVDGGIASSSATAYSTVDNNNVAININGGSVTSVYCGANDTKTFSEANTTLTIKDEATVGSVNTFMGTNKEKSVVTLYLPDGFDLTTVTDVYDAFLHIDSNTALTEVDLGNVSKSLNAVYGQPLGEVGLPETVSVKKAGSDTSFDMTADWDTDYQATVPGVYSATLKPSAGYMFTDLVDMTDLVFTITVSEDDSVEKHVKEVDYTATKTVPFATAAESLGLPTSLSATVDLIGESTLEDQPYSIPFITWNDLDGYNSYIPGEYRFEANMPTEHYSYADGFTAPVITITVEQSTEPAIVDLGDYANLIKIPVNSITELKLYDSYTVTDEDGKSINVEFKSWTVTDENGDPAVLDLTTPGIYNYAPKYVCNNPLADGLTFNIKVEVTETQIEKGPQSNLSYFFHGIPVVINTDPEKAGTYVYDATGLNKIFNDDISSSRIYGGDYNTEPQYDEATGEPTGYLLGTELESTSIIVKGGTLTAIYGGSGVHAENGADLANYVDDVTVKMYGGTVESIYVAGDGNISSSNTMSYVGHVKKVHFEFHGGTVTTRVALLGYHSVVTETAEAVVDGGTIAGFFTGSYSNYSGSKNSAEVEMFVNEGASIATLVLAGRKCTVNKIAVHLSEKANISTLRIQDSSFQGVGQGLYVYLDDVAQLKEFENGVLTLTTSPVFYYVDGVYLPVISELSLAQTDYVVENGTALADVGLPTSFVIDGANIGGFSWSGNYDATKAGTYVLSLVAPEGTYLAISVQANVRVKAVPTNIVSAISPVKTSVDVAYNTAIADAVAQLDSELSATVSGVSTVIPSTAFEWVCDDYKAYAPGTYTFSVKLVDESYAYADGYTGATVTVTVGRPSSEDGLVAVAIDVPVKRTVIPANGLTANIRYGAGSADYTQETYEFKCYDTLSATVMNEGQTQTVQLTGITWSRAFESADDNASYYVRTIEDYDQSGEIVIPDSLLEEASVVEVRVVGNYTNSSANFRSTCEVPVPITVVSSGYEAYSSGYKGYTGMAVMDALGLNNVNANMGITNAGIFHAGSSVAAVGDSSVTVDTGAVVTSVYGGSYLASFTGNTEITVKNGGSVTSAIYAGSNGADFIGDVTINLEKGCIVNSVVAAGSAAFLGDVVINIESGAGVNTISLGQSEVSNPNSVIINVSSDFDLSKIQDIDSGIIRVFVDGVEHYFASAIDFGDATIEVPYNAVSDYNTILPDVYVTAGGRKFLAPATDYTWTNEDNYDGAVSGEYVFTLKFNDNYGFINNAQYNSTLTIVVKVNPDDYRQVLEINTDDIPTSKIVAYGTPADLVGLPSEIQVSSYNIKNETAAEAVLSTIKGVEWECAAYDPYTSHNGEEQIEYVFTMVLPDGYVTTLAMPTVVVTISQVDYPTIISLNIPVRETYFASGVVISPVFYGSLEAEVLDADNKISTVTINGITWSCTSVYKPAIIGDYVFRIDESSFDNKYLVADGVIENSKITAHIISAAISNNYGQYKTNTSTVMPVSVGEWTGDSAYVGGLYDLTGCNLIYLTNGTSISSGVYGGTGYSLEANPGQTSVVYGVAGATGKLVGGSYGTAFTGNAIIKATGSVIVSDIYAGCINNVFTGNTDITIGGKAVITNIICGSTYLSNAMTSSTSGIVVGTQNVGYNGTVTINIEDDFEGVIGSINRSNATKVILNCSSSFNYAAYVDITDPAVSVYVDGKLVQTVSEIKAPLTVNYNVALGTEIEDIVLPTKLDAVVDGAEAKITDVTWECDEYDGTVPGKYTFTPVISSNYILKDTDISAANITVRVLSSDAGTAKITAFAAVSGITASLGTKQYQIAFPSTVKATVGGKSVDIEVDAWTCPDFDGSVLGAVYTFTAVVSSEYALDTGVSAPTVTVTIGSPVITAINVPVTETVLPRDLVPSPVFYDTLEVTLSDGRKETVSGFTWTSKDYKASSVGTSTFTIATMPEGYSVSDRLVSPKITVTISSEQPDGVSNQSIVFLNGIPAVAKGDLNETYVYDATGCNKIDNTNCIARTLYGGGPANSRAFKTTKVTLESGKVSGIYGGSKDYAKVTGTAYIYAYGGTVNSLYGGGNSSSTTTATLSLTQNTYIYCDGATIATRIAGGGWNDVVEGNTTIIVKNTTAPTIHAGTYCNAVAGRVEGTSTVKILDGTFVNVVQGTGRAATVGKSEVYLSNGAVVKQSVKPTMLSAAVNGCSIFYETGFDTSCIRSEDTGIKAYEGHFLEDRETFVTDRQISIIQNAELPTSRFYVDYGTPLEDVNGVDGDGNDKNLPTKAVCKIDGKAVTVSGFSYEPVSTYNGNISGEYLFKLTVPDGYILSSAASDACSQISVIVDERISGGTITSIYADSNTENTYVNGTSMYQLNLPTELTVMLSNGTEKSIRVKNWKITDGNSHEISYSGSTAGTYVFTPEFDESYTIAKTVKKLPIWTAHISEYAPYSKIVSNRRVLFLCGIPAYCKEADGATIIYDMTGNYIAQASAGTIMYCGGDSTEDGIESTNFTVYSGSIYAIYAGSRNQAISGSANLTIHGGTFSYLRMGGMGGSLNGANLTVTDGTITHIYGGYSDYNTGRITMNISGGTITDIYLGHNAAGGTALGTAQEEDEILSNTSIAVHGELVETGPAIKISKGETISGELRMTGGSVGNIFGGGSASGTIHLGSTKIYIEGGTVSAVYGAGGNVSSVTYGNSYTVIGSGASVSTLIPSGAGAVLGTSYVVLPSTFNRYNVLGWDENPTTGGDDGDASSESTDGTIVISGGMYKESCPVRFTMIGSTQVVFAYGVPIKIVGEEAEGTEYESASEIPTYVWYFNTNADDFPTDEEEAAEKLIDFEYPGYVDEDGNPIVLHGFWTKIETPLSAGSSPTVYGGGIAGATNKYASAYIEMDSGYIHNIYGGGKNDVMGSSNVILNGGYVNGSTYGGGHATTTTYTHCANVVVNSGSYNVIVGGGYTATTAQTNITVNGGYVGYIYGGTYSGSGTVTGEVHIDVNAGTVRNIYGGGYGSASVTKGPAYIDIAEGAEILAEIYPLGKGVSHLSTTTGAVNTKAYVTLPKSPATLYNQVTYTSAQAPYVYINGYVMGTAPDPNKYPYDTIAEKKVQVTTQLSSGTNDYIFLNGIPTILDSDGEGHSYLYLAKTKDGSLDAFTTDENGTIVSNVVHDETTGEAIKVAKLIDKDVTDDYIYGGASAASVEGVYLEIQDGACLFVCAGNRGGNVGYDKDGNEVGRSEIRQLGGSVYSAVYLGSHLGYTVTGDQTEYGDCTRCVYYGVDGVAGKTLNMGGYAGVVGSEEKYISGYYNKAGETITYESPVTGEEYEITGTWEDYNVDASKQDYQDYYDKTNAYFNGSGDASFLESKYYVDPDDDHYTTYCLLARSISQATFTGTKESQYDATYNRVYGNQYLRHSAYGLKYDAELDMFVEDYNDYKGTDTTTTQIFLGCQAGNSYGDIRCDDEGQWVYTAIYPVGRVTYGAVNFGQTYLNLFTEDSVNGQYTYGKTVNTTDSKAHIRRDFYPRWSATSAKALGLGLAQEAIDRGYITGVTDPKDVRISMLSASDAADLLNYYYRDADYWNPRDTTDEDYERVMNADGDAGNFVIRLLECRSRTDEYSARYTDSVPTKIGDCFIITLPNGQIMLVDSGIVGAASEYMRDLDYYLASAAENGIGDGNTIDYLVLTHYHTDHYGNHATIITRYDVKTFIAPPFDLEWSSGYVEIMSALEAKNLINAAQGKPEIEVIKPIRDYSMTIGTGSEEVEIYVMGPGNNSYSTQTFEKTQRNAQESSSGYTTEIANSTSLSIKFTYKNNSYISCGDAYRASEISMLRVYGEDFLNCDVLKLNHHGFTTSNCYPWLNACDPQVVLQPMVFDQCAQDYDITKYVRENMTGGYAEDIFVAGIDGITKVTMTGDLVYAEAQYRNKAYERDTAEYKNASAAYAELLEQTQTLRDSLKVVANGGTASYGTKYLWKSYASYIDDELFETGAKYRDDAMTLELLAEYTTRLEELNEFIKASTMVGGLDDQPDTTVPATATDSYPLWNGGTGSITIPDAGSEESTTMGGILVATGSTGTGGGTGEISGGGGGGGGGGAVVVDPTPTPDPTPDPGTGFIDVATTDWFSDAVEFVTGRGYFDGVGNNRFAPNDNMTRAMIVTVIGRVNGTEGVDDDGAFTDVSNSAWYADFVAWAAQNDIVKGIGDNKFDPDGNVTREQLAAILYRYAEFKGYSTEIASTAEFDAMPDSGNVSLYAATAMQWAVANSVIKGSNGKLNPQGYATRAEVAQMIMNFCNAFGVEA